jgi:mRNA-degrading endonuclease RelE of RelBE toxin-antitoxin system
VTTRRIIWPTPIRLKLLTFKSHHFLPDETLDFISQFILETEVVLSNPIVGRHYTEEYGEFKGISRIVIRKFRVYFEVLGHDVVILAVKFPGEAL